MPMGAPELDKNMWTIPVEMESQVKTIGKNQSIHENILQELPFFDGFYTGKYVEVCRCPNSDRYLYQCSYCYYKYGEKDYCDYDYEDKESEYERYHQYENEEYESRKCDAWQEFLESLEEERDYYPGWRHYL